MIERRTWTATVGQGALAALWVLAIAVSAYVASNMRDVTVFLEANHRTAVANSAMSDDQRLHAAGKSLAAIAPVLMSHVGADRDLRAVVVDDSGKVIAGDRDLMTGMSLPMIQTDAGPFRNNPRPPGFSGTPPPKIGIQAFGGPALPYTFGAPPPDVGFGVGPGPVRFPAVLGTSRASVGRRNGGWLVLAHKDGPIGTLGSWYWTPTVILTLLSFVTVWSLGRRTLLQSARPMARVERGLRRLVDVNNTTVEAISTDDAGLAAPLVESYNAAALELAAVLKQTPELEACIRQLLADGGHEPRTPLAVIMGYVQLLRERSAADTAMAE